MSGSGCPFVPYFSWSWNLRYDHPLTQSLRGYAQVDMAHKGDMWDDLHGRGLQRLVRGCLQPDYSFINLRFGLTPEGGHWLGEFYITNLANKNAIIFTNTGKLRSAPDHQ